MKLFMVNNFVSIANVKLNVSIRDSRQRSKPDDCDAVYKCINEVEKFDDCDKRLKHILKAFKPLWSLKRS